MRYSAVSFLLFLPFFGFTSPFRGARAERVVGANAARRILDGRGLEIVVGEHDAPFLAATDYMAAKIPRATKVIIPEAGHAPNAQWVPLGQLEGDAVSRRRGSQGAPLGDHPREAFYGVITSAQGWDALRARMPDSLVAAGEKDARAGKMIYLAAFGGVKGSSGYSLDVQKLTCGGGACTLFLSEKKPGAETVVEPAMTLPYLLIGVPASQPEGMRWLRTFLRARAAEGKTVLVSSHVLAEVEQTVDDVLIISKGRLLAQAPIGRLGDHTGKVVRVRTPQARANSARRRLLELFRLPTTKAISAWRDSCLTASWRFWVAKQMSALGGPTMWG